METKKMAFRGREFVAVKGKTHPGYSWDTFAREEAELRDKYWTVGPDDIVVDVGASYGSYTLTALAMGAEVWAYEPEPTVFVDLAWNVHANHWDTRAKLFNFGLSDVNGMVDMRKYAPHWPGHTIFGEYRVFALDSVAAVEPTWLKVDVEGHEEAVLRGALSIITRHQPKILVECHQFLDSGIKDRVRGMLHGYTFEEIPRDDVVILYGVPGAP